MRRRKGLEPLAAYIKEQEAVTEDVEIKAAEFISDEEGKEVASAHGCNSRCIRYNCRADIRCR